MSKQLKISFPLFSKDTLAAWRKQVAVDEMEKLKKELEHYKNSIRAYKGHKTKRGKK